jgi:DNA excision repair protein ERCC-6
LVVDAFQDRLGDSQHALFKRLLKVAATLEKNPPTMGGGGGTVWVLKEEFMRVV